MFKTYLSALWHSTLWSCAICFTALVLMFMAFGGAETELRPSPLMLWSLPIVTVIIFMINVAGIYLVRKFVEKGYREVPLKFSLVRFMENLIRL